MSNEQLKMESEYYKMDTAAEMQLLFILNPPLFIHKR